MKWNKHDIQTQTSQKALYIYAFYIHSGRSSEAAESIVEEWLHVTAESW